MEYVMVEISFLGNDDINFQGFRIIPVESKKEWEKQIKNKIKQELEENAGFMTIYSSDNDGTTFQSLEEVWATLKFKKISEDEFKVMKKVLKSSGEKVQYGHIPDFFDYKKVEPTAKLKK